VLQNQAFNPLTRIIHDGSSRNRIEASRGYEAREKTFPLVTITLGPVLLAPTVVIAA
jgi:hypothetical protein